MTWAEGARGPPARSAHAAAVRRCMDRPADVEALGSKPLFTAKAVLLVVIALFVIGFIVFSPLLHYFL